MAYIFTDPIALETSRNAIADMGMVEALASLLLDGPPGCGKTFLARQISEQITAKLLSFQAFPGCGKWEMLMDDPDPVTGARAKGLLLRAAEMSQQGKVVVLINEIDKAEASVDSFLLDFLNDGVLFIPQLGEFPVKRENFLCVITKNDQRNVTDALMRRCRCVNMAWPSLDLEMQIMQASIPGIQREACQYLIEIARQLRENPKVKKKPSPPEVVRLARDVIRMLKGESLRGRDLGKYISMGLLPLPSDREGNLFGMSEISTGKGAEENFGSSIGKVDLSATV